MSPLGIAAKAQDLIGFEGCDLSRGGFHNGLKKGYFAKPARGMESTRQCQRRDIESCAKL